MKYKMAYGGHICQRTGNKVGQTKLDYLENI